MLRVVMLQSSEQQTIPTNDFCRLFSKLGLVPLLTGVFNQFIDMYDESVEKQTEVGREGGGLGRCEWVGAVG